MLDIKTIDSTLSVAGFLFGAAAFTVTWLTRGSKANAVKIDQLEAENQALKNRVSDLEAVIANLPTREDFHAVTLKLSEMGGEISTVSTEVRAVTRIATRIDDYLLNKRGE